MARGIASKRASQLSMILVAATREDYDIVIRLFGIRHANGRIELDFSPQNRQLKMFMSGNMAKFHKWNVEKEITVSRALERVCAEELN